MSEQDVYNQLIQDIKTTKEREMWYRKSVIQTPALHEFLDPLIERLMKDAISMQDAAAAIRGRFPNVA